jgi:hypothetical protein
VNPAEVEKAFTVPVAFFRENEPERHQVMVQALPYIEGPAGRREVLFPARELGLPERYATPWSGIRTTVLIYRYAGEIIWGITAAIVTDLMRRLDP